MLPVGSTPESRRSISVPPAESNGARVRDWSLRGQNLTRFPPSVPPVWLQPDHGACPSEGGTEQLGVLTTTPLALTPSIIARATSC